MTFQTQFNGVINEMKAYLNRTNMNGISYTFPDKWNFKLSIAQKDFEKQSFKTFPEAFEEIEQ